MKALTETQSRLFNKLLLICKENYEKGLIPLTFDQLKIKSNEKTFDWSFNALLLKGYFFRYPTNDNNPRFLPFCSLK